MEGQFECWGCGLLYGEPGSPMLPSQLCAGCKGGQGGAETPSSDDESDTAPDLLPEPA